MSPPIEIFLTTIASQPQLRQRQEFLLRTLQVKKIPYTAHDLASDEDAKRLWKRKAPMDKQQLPGILVGGKFPGAFSEFEEAVEYDELDFFLRLNESWGASDGEEDDKPSGEKTDSPAQKPIGVPGAVSSVLMTPPSHRPRIFPASASASPSSLKNKTPDAGQSKSKGEEGRDIGADKSADVTTELEELGVHLDGADVTEDDLRKLVEELGLEGDEAGDLVKGLSGGS